MLADLDLELNSAGIHLAFAELQSAVRDTIVRYGLLETIDEGHLYGSVKEGVEAFAREAGGEAGGGLRLPAPRSRGQRPPTTRPRPGRDAPGA